MEPLAAPVRTLYSNAVGLGANLTSGRPARVNLLARDGVVDALERVTGDAASPGLWISSYLASQTRFAGRRRRHLRGSIEPVPIAGTYRDLWDGELEPYWDEVPDEFIPSFLRVMNSTNLELAIADADLVARLGGGGRAIWQATLEDVPTTYDELRALDSSYRSIERAFSGETEMAQQYRAAAFDTDVLPGVFSVVAVALERAGVLIDELGQPIRTTMLAGTAAGVVLSTLGGVFMIRRRRNEYRLHAADGDAWWRFFGRAITQYTLPAIAGIVVGVGIAYAAIVALGPSGSATLSAVPIRDVVTVSALACVTAALVTAALAVRLADGEGSGLPEPGRGWLFLVVGAAAAMWFQVGRGDSSGVNPLVVSFPFVGILAGVIVVILGFRLLLRAVRRTGRDLPTSLFLAWRALTASEGGALLLTAALGMAAGLAVLSTSFVTSIDTATADKAATIVGAASSVELRSSSDDAILPPGSTTIRYQDTKIGDRRARVIAIDPDTFADTVVWPSSFGSDPEAVLAALDEPMDDAVPAVVVEGGPRHGDLPGRGEFGSGRTFPFRRVASVGSFPLASESAPTLIVRADRLEDFARARFDAGAELVHLVDAGHGQRGRPRVDLTSRR